MQYTTGTISIASGTPTTVTGVGTHWLANVSTGWVFKLQSEDTIYEIQTVTDDTTLVIDPAYGGATISGASYVILRDYTARYQWPILLKGNVNWAAVLSESLRRIDSDLYETPSCRYIKFVPQSAPSSPVEGMIYYNSSSQAFVYYTGAAWRVIQSTLLT
jgi:hypothetical protein